MAAPGRDISKTYRVWETTWANYLKNRDVAPLYELIQTGWLPGLTHVFRLMQGQLWPLISAAAQAGPLRRDFLTNITLFPIQSPMVYWILRRYPRPTGYLSGGAENDYQAVDRLDMDVRNSLGAIFHGPLLRYILRAL